MSKEVVSIKNDGAILSFWSRTLARGWELGCMEKGEEEIKTHLFFKMINWLKVEAREVQPPFKPKIVSVHYGCVF